MEDIGQGQENPKFILMIDFDGTLYKKSLHDDLGEYYSENNNDEKETKRYWDETYCKSIVEGSFNISKEDFQKILNESKEAGIEVCIVSKTLFVPQVQFLMDKFFGKGIKVFGSGDFFGKGDDDLEEKNKIIEDAIKYFNVENRLNYNPNVVLIDDSENNVRECIKLKYVYGLVFDPVKGKDALKELITHARDLVQANLESMKKQEEEMRKLLGGDDLYDGNDDDVGVDPEGEAVRPTSPAIRLFPLPPPLPSLLPSSPLSLGDGYGKICGGLGGNHNGERDYTSYLRKNSPSSSRSVASKAPCPVAGGGEKKYTDYLHAERFSFPYPCASSSSSSSSRDRSGGR
jgi:hypothetical protein